MDPHLICNCNYLPLITYLLVPFNVGLNIPSVTLPPPSNIDVPVNLEYMLPFVLFFSFLQGIGFDIL